MGSSKRILIVEDEALVAQDIKDTLTDLGYDVVGTVDRGEEAIEATKKHKPDLVLMDIHLKGKMLGTEAADRIREDHSIPVVYLTAYSDDKTLEEAKVTRPFGYILKPFDEKVLKTTIEIALHVHDIDARRKEAEEHLDHLNQVLRAIRNVNQLIVKEKDPDRLISGVCSDLIETRGYNQTWIILKGPSGDVVNHAQSGLMRGFDEFVEAVISGKLPACVETLATEKEVAILENPKRECTECPIHLNTSFENSQALVTRLIHGNMDFGYLGASVPVNLIDPEELSLFEEVAGDIAFALYDIKLGKEHQQHLKALEESEKKYRYLFENSPVSILIIDGDGTVLDCNEATLSLTGLKRKAMINRPFSELGVIDDPQIKAFNSMIKRVVQSRGLGAFELEMTIGKTRVWIDAHTSLLEQRDDSVTIQLILKDITSTKEEEERKENEIRNLTAEKQDLEKELEELQTKIRPRREVEKRGKPQTILDIQRGYLIESMEHEEAMALFTDHITHGHQGLCITRHNPEILRTKYDIKKTPFIWLTTNVLKEEACISPSQITKLSQSIVSFLEEAQKGIILLMGLEYLISQTSFKSAINLIYLLNDKIMAGDDILLVNINPDALDNQELNILRSELTRIDVEDHDGQA